MSCSCRFYFFRLHRIESLNLSRTHEFFFLFPDFQVITQHTLISKLRFVAFIDYIRLANERTASTSITIYCRCRYTSREKRSSHFFFSLFPHFHNCECIYQIIINSRPLCVHTVELLGFFFFFGDYYYWKLIWWNVYVDNETVVWCTNE